MKLVRVFCSCVLLCCSTLLADTHYVDISNAIPSAPYTSWGTAATNIQDAVDAAVAGDTVLVADGHYLLSSVITVTKEITIQSVNGPAATMVDGQGSVQCFRLLNYACVINGLTITNGYVNGNGGGIHCSGTRPFVTNCIISGNTASTGGGMYRGTADHCIISDNDAYSGGGIYGGTANYCEISGNTAENGGGMSGGIAIGCEISGNIASVNGGGKDGGAADDCIITGNSAGNRGGGIYYGMAENCVIDYNTAGSGGGMYYGMAQNCFIENNSAAGGLGGGIFRGTAWNCAISHNSAFVGGGIYNATIYNCTVTRNVARVGGGMQVGTAYNSISWYNTGAVVNQDMNNVAAFNCCSPDVEHGISGNITNMPLLVSVSHVSSDSPCVAAGSPWHAAGTDIDGQPWLNPPSIGCDEFIGAGSVTGVLHVSIGEAYGVTAGHPSGLFADISGPVSSHVWDFGDGTAATNMVIPGHIWQTAGAYEVKLTAYSDTWPGGLSTTQTVQVATLDEATLYVDAGKGNDSNDGADWANAKQSINAAIESHQYIGGRVLVAAGVYGLAEGIVVDKSLLIEGFTGAAETIIDGNGAHLCVYLGPGCRLRGLSVRNGIGGIQGFFSSVVDRCRVYENAGTGIWGGSAYDSVIRNNMNWGGVGGGLDDARAFNCLVVSNLARIGGGIDMSGGYDTTEIGDYEVQHCVIIGNMAEEYGGGILGGSAHNCLVAENYANISGGGIFKTAAMNCTVADNGSGGVGGADQSSVYNSIIYGNAGAEPYPEISEDSLVSSSCSPGLAHGADGNITNTPVFVDAYNSDYRLLATSPCIDSGFNDDVMTAADLDGNPRIMDGDLDGDPTVDMGAYEFQAVTIPAGCIRTSTINTKSKGRTPVTILSTADFDATLIDPASVRCGDPVSIRYADAACVHQTMKDLDGDGIMDLKLHFLTPELDIDVATGKVMLMGQTYDGTYVVGGCDVKMR